MGDVLMLRRLVAAAVVATGLVAVGELPAQAACPAAPATLDQQTVRADDVFTGTVEDRLKAGSEVRYRVSVDRVYQGRLDAAEATVTTPAAPGACGLPDLRVGDELLFLTRGDDLRTTARSGTAPATDARVRRVERLLGEGRPATPAEPVRATFTSVGSGTAGFQRVAAPGAALVLVGLLGLLAATVMGRRRA